MLLTLTTTHEPATDIGYLLHKNPASPHSFRLSFGNAHVFYPEATRDRCTVALLVEVDPVGLVRTRRGPAGEGGALEQYVNDRPYAASSFLSVAIAEVFGSAMSGKSRERSELVDMPLPLRVTISSLPCRGHLGGTGDPPVTAGDAPTESSVPEILRRLFAPLGYSISARRVPLDETFPDWGESAYYRVELEARLALHQLLSHLYVLVPVLDNDKHYWVGDDEVEKLLRHGEGWLAAHPEREAITRRYLKHQRSLVDDALAQLVHETEPNPDVALATRDAEEAALEALLCSSRGNEAQTSPRTDRSLLTSAATQEKPIPFHEKPRGSMPAVLEASVGQAPSLSQSIQSLRPDDAEKQDASLTLNDQRLGAVLAALKASGAARVLDLGCGEGRLLQALLKEKQFAEIVGMDVSHRALEIARDRLHYDRLPPIQKQRLHLLHGSLIYRDERLAGYDAAALVEVIEHMDAPRLAAFERVLFECAKPTTIVITTPNREFNVKWERLPAGQFRHRDHRFEWTRAEFQEWASRVAARFGYNVRFLSVGPEDPAVGSPTQMGVFEQTT